MQYNSIWKLYTVVWQIHNVSIVLFGSFLFLELFLLEETSKVARGYMGRLLCTSINLKKEILI